MTIYDRGAAQAFRNRVLAARLAHLSCEADQVLEAMNDLLRMGMDADADALEMRLEEIVVEMRNLEAGASSQAPLVNILAPAMGF